MPAPQRPTRDARLIELLHEVEQARMHLRDEKQSRRPDWVSRQTQLRRSEDLLEALKAFAEAAQSVGAPLPYRYRDEMRLLSAMHPFAGQTAAAPQASRTRSQRPEAARE